MATVDFMKVFDAAAASLNAATHINVEALDLNRYSATMLKDDTDEIQFIADLSESDIDLTLAKKFIPLKEYKKFLSAFEYNLEQKFFKNIELKTSESGKEYRIKISF